MSYKHLTIAERSKIETLLELGYSIRKIAKQLNRQPSSISRELRRHAHCTAEEAQVRYQSNKSNCGAKLKLTPKLKEAVQEKLGETWSPEQIVGRLYKGKLSFKTIYRWIYQGLLEVPLTVLRQKENARNREKQEVVLTLVHPSQNAPKKFVNAKPLVIGSSIRSFLDVGKQRAASLLSLSVKPAGTQEF